MSLFDMFKKDKGVFSGNHETYIKIQLIDCDYAPQDMEAQLPITCSLIRMIPGSDRADYWLAKCEKSVKHEDKIFNYLIVAPRFVGEKIEKGMGSIALGVAYVTDESLVQDIKLDFNKCKYVAICTAKEL